MSCNVSQYNLGVRNILLGKSTTQKFCISTKPDTVLATLNEKFFVVHAPVTNAKHYFWFNTGTGVDPAVPNATGHEVEIVALDSKNTVATKLATAMAALSTLFDSAVAMGDHVDVEMKNPGFAYESRDALEAADRTGFKFTLVQYGRVQRDMGATEGDITATIEEQVQEITSPQTGDFVLGEIRRGVRVSMAFSLKSTSADQIREAINFYGSTIVTDDADSTVIAGYGSKNLFKSTEDVTTQLILRAPDFAEANDASEDFTLHKAKLKLGELTMSAENEFVLPVEVVGYLDKTKHSSVNMFSYGDASKIPAQN